MSVRIVRNAPSQRTVGLQTTNSTVVANGVASCEIWIKRDPRLLFRPEPIRLPPRVLFQEEEKYLTSYVNRRGSGTYQDTERWSEPSNFLRKLVEHEVRKAPEKVPASRLAKAKYSKKARKSRPLELRAQKENWVHERPRPMVQERPRPLVQERPRASKNVCETQANGTRAKGRMHEAFVINIQKLLNL